MLLKYHNSQRECFDILTTQKIINNKAVLRSKADNSYVSCAYTCNFDLDPGTLILKLDLNNYEDVHDYLHTEKKVCRSRHSKVTAQTYRHTYVAELCSKTAKRIEVLFDF